MPLNAKIPEISFQETFSIQEIETISPQLLGAKFFQLDDIPGHIVNFSLILYSQFYPRKITFIGDYLVQNNRVHRTC
jgi:hypothetical protein